MSIKLRHIGLAATLCAALALGIAGFGVFGSSRALAQEAAPAATSLDQLLNLVRQGRARDNQENQRREAEFSRRKADQQRLYDDTLAQIRAEEAKSDRLEATFQTNEAELGILQVQLAERLGAFSEMFGVIRQVAGEARGHINQSIISAQIPGRTPFLDRMAQSRELPTIEELEQLWFELQREMTEQGKIVRFDGPVITVEGETDEGRTITRLGPFTAISKGEFLTYRSGEAKLAELPRQPGNRFTSAASSVERAKADDGFVSAAIDISSGQILSLLLETPNLAERIDQGGIVGYTIIALAGLGILLGLWRILVLWGVSGAVKRQIRSQRINKGNPLGRILLVYDENKDTDVETLELKLDDAILRELPKLELGLSTLKLLAAVAPLLGLLGTVIGMIITFQSITLYGTGDPKIMAGGISTALVTTVLGLTAAIPLLFIHSFANGSSRSVQQVLEEQSAGIVARHAEGRR